MTSREKLEEALRDSGFVLEFINGKLKVTEPNNLEEYVYFSFDEDDDISQITGILNDD